MNDDKKKMIFMIDDDMTICDLINHSLGKSGYLFECQNRMEDALPFIEQNLPDLILLDLHLPDGSGIHLAKDIRNNRKICDIPIFMLTTREFSIEKSMAMQAGVTQFIQKPIDLQDLTAAIDDILSPTIDLKFWGVRGSTPCANRENMIYGGNTSCLQIVIPECDELLILDSGSGIRNLGTNLTGKNRTLSGRIFITHAHWDHIQGFPFFKPIYSPNNQFTVHMPDQLIGGAREVLSGQMTYTYFPITPEMLQAGLDYHTQSSRLQDYGSYKVEFLLSNHPVATAIFKIHTGGRVIVYCPDNELVPEENGQKIPFKEHLKEFVYNADVVIHDSQFDRETYPQKRHWGHSAWEDATELCAESKVKNLFLSHHDPDADDNYLSERDLKLQEYESDFESIQLAKEDYIFRMKKKGNKEAVAAR